MKINIPSPLSSVQSVKVVTHTCEAVSSERWMRYPKPHQSTLTGRDPQWLIRKTLTSARFLTRQPYQLSPFLISKKNSGLQLMETDDGYKLIASKKKFKNHAVTPRKAPVPCMSSFELFSHITPSVCYSMSFSDWNSDDEIRQELEELGFRLVEVCRMRHPKKYFLMFLVKVSPTSRLSKSNLTESLWWRTNDTVSIQTMHYDPKVSQASRFQTLDKGRPWVQSHKLGGIKLRHVRKCPQPIQTNKTSSWM